MIGKKHSCQLIITYSKLISNNLAIATDTFFIITNEHNNNSSQIVTDRVPETWVSSFGSAMKFLAYLMNFQSGGHQRHSLNL